MATKLEILRLSTCQKCNAVLIRPNTSRNCICGFGDKEVILDSVQFNGPNTNCPAHSWDILDADNLPAWLIRPPEVLLQNRAARQLDMILHFNPTIVLVDLQQKLESAVATKSFSAEIANAIEETFIASKVK